MAKRKSVGLRSREEYQGLNTNEARGAEIMAAGSADELDTMWDAWAERGLDPQGGTRAAVLARKVELGTKLTEAEQKALDVAERRQATGKKKSPIRGRLNTGRK